MIRALARICDMDVSPQLVVPRTGVSASYEILKCLRLALRLPVAVYSDVTWRLVVQKLNLAIKPALGLAQTLLQSVIRFFMMVQVN